MYVSCKDIKIGRIDLAISYFPYQLEIHNAYKFKMVFAIEILFQTNTNLSHKFVSFILFLNLKIHYLLNIVHSSCFSFQQLYVTFIQTMTIKHYLLSPLSNKKDWLSIFLPKLSLQTQFMIFFERLVCIQR